MTTDPLDGGSPSQMAWETFRASFAVARIHLWTIRELGDGARHYLADLEERWYAGFLNAEALAEGDPEYDRAIPVQDPNNRGVTFFARSEGEELYAQLFPHGHSEADPMQAALGLITVGVLSALESYSKARGVDVRGALSASIRQWLSSHDADDLPAGCANSLVDCEQTRHVYVHNRGIVDQNYIDRVADCRFQLGERRRLDTSVAESFAETVWKVGLLVRAVG